MRTRSADSCARMPQPVSGARRTRPGPDTWTSALRHAEQALADLEAAKQACDHWKSLHPID